MMNDRVRVRVGERQAPLALLDPVLEVQAEHRAVEAEEMSHCMPLSPLSALVQVPAQIGLGDARLLAGFVA